MHRLLRLALTGALLGTFGVLLFGMVHAITIVPIWRRLFGGLPFGVAAGLAVTWAYHEARLGGAWRATLRAGAWFGLMLWLALLPGTLLNNTLRVLGRGAPSSTPRNDDVPVMLLAALAGAAVGALTSRTRRGALAGAVATSVLLAAGGGPIPFTNGMRAFGLWVGTFVVFVCGGVALAWSYGKLVAGGAGTES